MNRDRDIKPLVTREQVDQAMREYAAAGGTKKVYDTTGKFLYECPLDTLIGYPTF